LTFFWIPNPRIKSAVVEFWPRFFCPFQGPLPAKDRTLRMVFCRREYVIPMGMAIDVSNVWKRPSR
jgi:hypothetical protein